MKRKLLFALAALLILALPACNMSPEAKLLAARKTYVGTVRSLTVLRQAGAFTKSEGKVLSETAHAGLRTLDRWEAQIALDKQRGGISAIAPKVRIFADEFNAVMRELVAMKIAAERHAAEHARDPATTAPGG